jgi:hypothetical protein
MKLSFKILSSTTLLVFLLTVLSGCQNIEFSPPQPGYIKEGTKIYYQFVFPKFLFTGENKKLLLENVDLSSFTILNEYYAKDKNKVYFMGAPSRYADSASFKVLKNTFGADKDSALLAMGSSVMYSPEELPHLSFDSETFEILDHSYIIKDKNGVYHFYRGDSLEGLRPEDPQSFELLEYDFAKDKDHVYFLNRGYLEILQEVDVAAFKILNDRFIKDNNAVYRITKVQWRNPGTIIKLNQIDPDTFQVINKSYARDKKGFYSITENELVALSEDQKMPRTAPCYVNDGSTVYFLRNGEKIKMDGADATTFKETENTMECRGKDKNFIFKNDSPEEFLTLDYEYVNALSRVEPYIKNCPDGSTFSQCEKIYEEERKKQ